MTEHLPDCRPSEGFCAEGCPIYPQIRALQRDPEKEPADDPEPFRDWQTDGLTMR